MIRLATTADIPRMLELCQQFHFQSPYKETPYSVSKTRSLLERVLKSDEGLILVAEREGVLIGLIGGLVAPIPFADVRVAQELAWWVDPKYRPSKDGIKLLEAYEYWAKNIVKVNQISVANLMNEYAPALERMYTRRGYEKKEEVWLYQL